MMEYKTRISGVVIRDIGCLCLEEKNIRNFGSPGGQIENDRKVMKSA